MVEETENQTEEHLSDAEDDRALHLHRVHLKFVGLWAHARSNLRSSVGSSPDSKRGRVRTDKVPGTVYSLAST